MDRLLALVFIILWIVFALREYDSIYPKYVTMAIISGGLQALVAIATVAIMGGAFYVLIYGVPT